MARRVKAQVPGLQNHRSLGRSTTHQGSQPSDQDRVGEWLGQVVIGPAVERADLVGCAVARGQHQDRRPDSSLSELLADLESADLGQHQVEHDGVVWLLSSHPQAIGAVERDIDREAVRLEAIAQAGRQPLFVLDHQHSHRVILAQVAEQHLNGR